MNHSTKALSRRGALAGLTAMLVVSVLMSGAARAVTPEEIKVKGTLEEGVPGAQTTSLVVKVSSLDRLERRGP